ncbi:MAG TPA: hypothetical protein VLL48_03020 [Longimicrobiales bacterium]|nr:hypothetical protein [Longimicrobiales bacterium]
MREWIIRGTVESVLIISSILLALAVDEWRENEQHRELANQALLSFAREMRQNQARIEDAAPYHRGLRQVIARLAYDARGTSATDLQSVVEGLEPTVLLNTAWETAVATGALNYMGYETVSALSLTYSLQERFEEFSRTRLPRLNPLTGSDAELQVAIRQALNYVQELSQREQELIGIYQQALHLIADRAPAAAGAFSGEAGDTGAGGEPP